MEFLLGLASLSLLVACAATQESIVEAGGQRLTGDELRVVMSGVSLDWATGSGPAGTADYAADGTARASFGQNNWIGSWTVEEDLFCTSFAERPGNPKRCFTVYREPDGGFVWFTPDGDRYLTASIR